MIIKSVNPEYDTYERDAAEVHVIGPRRLGGSAAVKRLPHALPEAGAVDRHPNRCRGRCSQGAPHRRSRRRIHVLPDIFRTLEPCRLDPP